MMIKPMQIDPNTPSVAAIEPQANIGVTESPAQNPAPFTPAIPSNPPIKKPPLPLIPILGGIIILLIISLLIQFIQSKRTNTVPVEIAPSPTVAATPTPMRKPSALFATEAFASFSAQKASFSSEINNFSFQEGLFTPPTLDLDLGIYD